MARSHRLARSRERLLGASRLGSRRRYTATPPVEGLGGRIRRESPTLRLRDPSATIGGGPESSRIQAATAITRTATATGKPTKKPGAGSHMDGSDERVLSRDRFLLIEQRRQVILQLVLAVLLAVVLGHVVPAGLVAERKSHRQCRHTVRLA